MSEIRVTKHSSKRIRQRIGLNKKSVNKNAEKALMFGVTHKEAKGKLLKYMDAIYLKNELPNNMRVFNRMLYLFRETTLITVLSLPNCYWVLADKLQKEKVKSLENI